MKYLGDRYLNLVFLLTFGLTQIFSCFYSGCANGDEVVEVMHVPDLTDAGAIEEGSLWSFPDYTGDIWSRPALT